MGRKKSVAGAAIEPEIVEFGPHRVIGLRYAGNNANGKLFTYVPIQRSA